MITPAKKAARFGILDWGFKDLSGARYGRLTVLERDGTDIGGHVRWICKCDCGQRTIADGTSLRLARTRSCSCFMASARQARGRALRLTRLSFRKAIRIHDALDRAIGVERLDKIFATIFIANSKRCRSSPRSKKNK